MMESVPRIDVLMLQEASCRNENVNLAFEKQLEYAGCTMIHTNAVDRAMTIIRRESIHEYRILVTEKRFLAVEVAKGDLRVTLVNHYGPHKKEEGGYHYVKINEQMRELSCRGTLLFGGDHNTVLASTERTSGRLDVNSAHFKAIVEGLQLSNVNTLTNRPHFHTFFRGEFSSRIDTVWCNPSAIEIVRDVERYTANGVGSDHIPTMVEVCWSKMNELGPTKVKPKFPKRDNRMWVDYSKEVVGKLDKTKLSGLNAEEQCSKITTILKECAEMFPKSKPITKGVDNRRVRRWLKDRKVLVERLSSQDTGYQKLWRVCQAYNEDSTLRGVMTTLKVVDRLIQAERVRRANKRFAKWLYKARTSEFVDPRFFFNAATGKKAMRLRFKCFKRGNKVVTEPDKVAEHAADYFEEVFEQDFANMTFLEEMGCRTDNMENKFPPFKVEEVQLSLQWLRNNKAPGDDGIFNEMLKLTHTKERDYRFELAETLMAFFNKILETGQFPSEWKRCIIVPAYKKGCPMLIANFRPICLLSGLSKVFTRLLNQRVSVAAESMGVFNNTQGGGRKMRDIREKLSIIRGVIDHANRKDTQLYLLLTDISKAFDSVPHNAVTAAYRFFNFPESIVTLVRNMLESNVATVGTRHASRSIDINRGTRQGDSLSPTTYVIDHQLVLLYAKQRASGYQAMSQRIWNVAYVDDCNLFSDDLQDIQSTANDMYRALKWVGLTMHPDKLEFFARKVDGDPVTIRVANKVITAKDKHAGFRALGLFTNLIGDTEAQKKQAKQKVLRILNRLRMLKLGPSLVSRIVNPCIHPVFLFASEFTHWPKKWLNEIEGIGRKAVKYGSSAMKRFPSLLLSVERDNGGIGLNDFKESLTAKIGAFVVGMLQGKRDTEARTLLLDTLDDVKQSQTLVRSSIFQSNNRLCETKHSYLSWCAKLLHGSKVRVGPVGEHECEKCSIGWHLPTGDTKLLIQSGITKNSQLFDEDGIMVMPFEEAKRKFKLKGIGPSRYSRIRAYLEILGRPCEKRWKEQLTPNDTLEVLIGDKSLINTNVREGLVEHFTQMRTKSIESEAEWVLEAELPKDNEWNEFLKCPFGLERNELWFYHQVRSGTLHTKTVLRDMYEPSMEVMCAHCASAPETITHLLVECDEAKRARKELVQEFKDKLDKLEFMRPAKLKIWFDNVVYNDGRLVPLSPSRRNLSRANGKRGRPEGGVDEGAGCARSQEEGNKS